MPNAACRMPNVGFRSCSCLSAFGIEHSALAANAFSSACYRSSGRRAVLAADDGEMVRLPVSRALEADLLPDDLDIPNGADLDASGLRPRELRRHTHGLLHVLGLDQVEAAEHFFRFGERSVERRLAAVPDPHRLRVRGIVEHL